MKNFGIYLCKLGMEFVDIVRNNSNDCDVPRLQSLGRGRHSIITAGRLLLPRMDIIVLILPE